MTSQQTQATERRTPIIVIPNSEGELERAVREERGIRFRINGEVRNYNGVSIATKELLEEGVDVYATQKRDSQGRPINDVELYRTNRSTTQFDHGAVISHLHYRHEIVRPSMLGYGLPRHKLEEAGLWEENRI